MEEKRFNLYEIVNQCLKGIQSDLNSSTDSTTTTGSSDSQDKEELHSIDDLLFMNKIQKFFQSNYFSSFRTGPKPTNQILKREARNKSKQTEFISKIYHGRVIYYKLAKRFGFIHISELKQDIFVCEDDLVISSVDLKKFKDDVYHKRPIQLSFRIQSYVEKGRSKTKAVNITKIQSLNQYGEQMWLLFLAQLFQSVDPEAVMNFQALCKNKGYDFESHQVTTQDGYILNLFRIPGKQKNKVVFMQHGLIDLADTWVTNDPAPGFMMADAGFDVWFGNSRGSFHSLGHVSLNWKTDKAYWNFTWQHMEEFDLPASIDYVLRVTGEEKLTYIGHSQGTLIMFAHLSANPEFINKLHLFVALAPVFTVRHLNLGIFNVLENLPLTYALQYLGVYNFMPNPEMPATFYYLCKILKEPCDDIIKFYADINIEVDNTQRFPIILAHEPGGTSIFNMEHWQQMTWYQDFKLQKFDYGLDQNKNIYGQSTPPLYDFTKIPGPIALYLGMKDRLADSEDTGDLRASLPKGVVVHQQVYQEFGHATFIWGKGMTYFQDVVSTVQKYSYQQSK